MAQYVCAVIKDVYGWPNDYFIPQDPCDVLLQLPFGEMELIECYLRFQRDLSIKIHKAEVWFWSRKRLDNIVDFLLAKQKG